MKISNRKSLACELNKFCCMSKEHDFIEVTEWSNGEGWDIAISSNTDKNISLTSGELEGIKTLVSMLDNNIAE